MSEIIPTDPQRWRLHVNAGVHRWQYLDQAASTKQPQSVAEKYFLGLPTGLPKLPVASNFQDAARNGFRFYEKLQLDDRHWACAYGGPSFLLAGLVIPMYISETEIPAEWKIEIIQYLSNTVNKDGGWGLHSAGDTTVFATALYYITLRIVGLEPTEPLASKARARGATAVPQWGKVWLALLNLYSWSAVNPIPPEFWLLPDWVPFHPWRWWVQCRVVYLPVSYLYANKVTKPLNPLLQSLRQESLTRPFEEIDFNRFRNTTAPSDLKKPLSPFLRAANVLLRFWENYIRPDWLAQWANQRVCVLILCEDRNTSYNCLAPVNKALHMVSVWHSEGADSARMNMHREKIAPYMWKGENGMTCSGTNGVQAWDTAFTIQAIVDAGFGAEQEFRSSLENALKILDISQFRDNLDDPYRQPRKGGWQFSTKDNGYVGSYCAAEGLKAVLMLQEECNFPKIISDDRLYDCVDTLLLLQNSGGGFSSYERSRASTMLEYLNASEIFDRIMVEYSYPECSTAVVTALSLFRQHFPEYRSSEIDQAISRAVSWIISEQRPNGGWYAFWGVCFTYASLFAMQSLELEYIQHEQSQVVNTAWACLALRYAQFPDKETIERGLKFNMSRQQSNGEWPQEDLEGVFNNTCMIRYPNYKLYFTSWALGRYNHIYLPTIKKVE
ncbi:terpene synthase [Penicillium malachiteum]|nr:terpene synthase [Penicillium malachiteum]